MKTSIATTLLAAASYAAATRVSYDTVYSDKSLSLTRTPCSYGSNGLMTKYGWKNVGEIPTKYVGGSSDVAAWNSDKCGQCYQVDYNGKTIHMLAIDYAGNGLNIAKGGLDELTNGNAYYIGVIDATVTKVDLGSCLTGSSKREATFKA
ncbi:Cerato-platanin [Teratosphaeria nubilosa]|uniref:Cerato-platanin n=1 Tax=Teratosphaeria nubilosa TaxID=161662 RepID=A0A6G1LCA4_9PEZI|nr:Cerato-platanin [Teratosphaeria nubilosa]